LLIEGRVLARLARVLVALWGIGGVVALLVQAVVRLGPLALEALRMELVPLQWGVVVVWSLWMAYSEGWRGFHLRFSPRVVARAWWLAEHPTAVRVLLAPFFCMSLFGASRRGLIVARVLVLAILGLVIVIRMLEQPWRGIVDAGVVLGLALGLVSLLVHAARALGGARRADPDVG
jgi:hypothetical protein